MVSERYLEWLDREEEILGIGVTIGATADMEAARELLKRELGDYPTGAQLEAFMEAGAMKYKQMPEIGVSFQRIEHVWGKQSIYRDVETGQFVSGTYVQEALARLEL